MSRESLRVFISYARSDASAFAEELVKGLEVAGFEPFLDRHDIAAGEDWEARLSALIQSADTITFVITPASVASGRCTWEIERAETLGKRIIPVLALETAEDTIPKKLLRFHYIQFSPRRSYSESLGELAAALRSDLTWIREHTRLGELARRWHERGRSEALLLRGPELDAAHQWLGAWKAPQPEPTDLHRSFINESEAVQGESVRRQRRRQRLLLIAVGAVAAVFGVLAVASTMLAINANRSAEAARESARVAEQARTRERAALARANTQRDAALRARADADVARNDAVESARLTEAALASERAEHARADAASNQAAIATLAASQTSELLRRLARGDITASEANTLADQVIHLNFRAGAQGQSVDRARASAAALAQSSNPEIREALGLLITQHDAAALGELDRVVRGSSGETDQTRVDAAALTLPTGDAARNSPLSELERLLAPARNRIRVSLDGYPDARVRIGEMIQVNVSSALAGKLILIDRDAAGSITVVTPNTFGTDVEVAANSQFSFPRASDGFRIRAQPPLGAGALYAILAPANVDISSIAFRSGGSSRGFVSEPLSELSDVVQQTQRVISSASDDDSLSGWGFAVLPYEIVAAAQ